MQRLAYLAAADGNAPALGMLLALFRRAPWLLHFGPVTAEGAERGGGGGGQGGGRGGGGGGGGGAGGRHGNDSPSMAAGRASRASDALARASAALRGGGDKLTGAGAASGSSRQGSGFGSFGGAGKGAGAGDASSVGNGSAREWGEAPSLARRSVSRWAGLAAASFFTFDLRALLSHTSQHQAAAAAGGGGGGGAGPAAAARRRLGALRAAAARAAGAGVGADGLSDSTGSPASTPRRLLSPSASGKARAAAALGPLAEHTPHQLHGAATTTAGGASEAAARAYDSAAGASSFGASSDRSAASGAAVATAAAAATASEAGARPAAGQFSLLRSLSRQRLRLAGWGSGGGGGGGGSGGGANDGALPVTASSPGGIDDGDDNGGLLGCPVSVEVRAPSPLAALPIPHHRSGYGRSASLSMGGAAAAASVAGSLQRGGRALLRLGSAGASAARADAAASARKGVSEGGLASPLPSPRAAAPFGRDPGDALGLAAAPLPPLRSATPGGGGGGGAAPGVRAFTSLKTMRPGAASRRYPPGFQPRATADNSMLPASPPPPPYGAAAAAAAAAAAPGPAGLVAAAVGAAAAKLGGAANPGAAAGAGAAPPADLLGLAMRSQQAAAARLVVDALVAGAFSRASVMVHLLDALERLAHDPQQRRNCRKLLKHLPMVVRPAPCGACPLRLASFPSLSTCLLSRSLCRLSKSFSVPPNNKTQDTGEVEVDSALTRHGRPVYKCADHGAPGRLWASVASAQQPLVEALDVLARRAGWRDSASALLLMPVVLALRRAGAAWLWLKRRNMHAK